MMPRAGDYQVDILLSVRDRGRLPIAAELASANGQTVAETAGEFWRYPVRMLDEGRATLARRVMPWPLGVFVRVFHLRACEIAAVCDWPTADAWVRSRPLNTAIAEARREGG